MRAGRFRRAASWCCASMALLLAVPSSAASEDPVWTFEVLSIVEHGPTHHVLHLLPAPPGVEFPRTCKEFVVDVTLQRGRGVPARLYRYFDLEGYEIAIQKVRQVHSQGELLRLGSLERGFGLGPDPEKQCEVLSRGLGVLLDDDSKYSVFSVY